MAKGAGGGTGGKFKAIMGTERNDTLKGDHNDGDTIYGLGGDDIIQALNGNDFLFGGAGNDKIYAGGGNDLIWGGLGNDYIDGGDGIDTASYADVAGSITVDLSLTTAQNTGSDGIDTLINVENLIGSVFNDRLFGNFAANQINGGDGNDFIDGRDGDDSLGGNNGNDTIWGGAGNDLIYAGEGQATDVDVIDGGSGIDTIDFIWAQGAGVQFDLRVTTAQSTGSAGLLTATNFENISGSMRNDNLTGDDFANRIQAGAGDDVINGMAGNDILDGFTGSDVINGGAGDDIVSGGMIGALGERDVLTGGTGADTFVFANLGYSRVESADIITDFNAAEGDRIDMRNDSFSPPLTFISNAEFSNVAYQMRVVSGLDGQQFVEVDYDANGIADLRIEVMSNVALTANDFIL